MNNYRVKIKMIITDYMDLEADSKEEAILKVTDLLNKCVYVSLCGVASCWLVFDFLCLNKPPFFINQFTIPNKSLNRKAKVIVIIILLVLYALVATGNFGYFAKDSSISNYTDKLYDFIILIITYYFLYDNGKFNNKKFYYILVAALSLLGIMSGSKSHLLMPMFILYIVEGLRENQWNNKYLKYIPILLVSAFILIIPIRYMIKNDVNLTQNESISLVSQSADGESLGTMVVNNFIDRINYVPVLSVALEHKGNVPKNVSELWKYTFLSPIYAFVPRFIYSDKPSNTFSNWYAYNLMGSTEDNHMSATYQGILYMNGGILSVILGFMLVGALFYFIYSFYFQDQYIYMYISQILSFLVLPAEPWTLYVTVIQNLIVFYIIHKFILK